LQRIGSCAVAHPVEKLEGIEDGMGPMWNLSFLEVVGQQEEEEGKKKRKKTKGV
jgi:hypothetical protein